MQLPQTLLSQHHSYIPIYKHAYKVLSKHEDAMDVSIRLQVMPGPDQKRYNLPTADEVVVILPGDGSLPNHCNIVLHCHSEDNLM